MAEFIAAPEIQVARTVLTNAQIKALPTTSIKLLDRPTSGSVIMPMLALCVFRPEAGAFGYTNLDPAATMSMDLFDFLGDFDTGLPNAGSLLSLNSPAFVRVQPLQSADTSSTRVNGVKLLATDVEIFVDIDNGAAGNLTGGHANNTLTIDIFFYVPQS